MPKDKLSKTHAHEQSHGRMLGRAAFAVCCVRRIESMVSSKFDDCISWDPLKINFGIHENI
jgi:hypothetical protein